MTKTIKRVVPAILTDNPASFRDMMRKAESFTDWVQVDIMDGIFVPSLSVTSDDIRSANPVIGWEAHLMVQEPDKYIEKYRLAGAKRILVHYEAVKKHALDMIDKINCMDIKAGMAINPETPVEVLSPNIVGKLDSILVMAVHPGYYGAKFIPEVLDKIELLKRLYPRINIGIDGGIKAENVAQAAAAGADEICVGSAIFAQDNPGESYINLLELAKKGWAKRINF